MAELPRSMERDASGGGVDRVLRASGIIKEYPGAVATRVLHGVDLEIRRGEFAALMGPSGSGKSTFLNIIGLLDRPTEGTVHICGTDTSGLDDDGLAGVRARSLGFIFQFHHLLPAFTAEENVAMPMAAAHGRMTDEMRARAGVLLEAVGLGDRRKSMATRLSGGQQQRVAIARALVMEPPLVLADEPTGNLDTESAGHVFELLRQFNEERGTTFLIVTHDPRLAERCDRLIELVDGRKVRDGPIGG